MRPDPAAVASVANLSAAAWYFWRNVRLRLCGSCGPCTGQLLSSSFHVLVVLFYGS